MAVSVPHPCRKWQLFVVCIVCISVCCAAGLYWWSQAWLASSSDKGGLGRRSAKASSAVFVVDPHVWEKVLWVPFQEAAPVIKTPPPPPPTPPTVTLFSVVIQGGKRTAMIDFGGTTGLRKMSTGAEYQSLRIIEIADDHIRVNYKGDPFRLDQE